ncbi:hypothetical protein JCM10207_001874 [Rhodosporidiobolus poonsookiae]
MPRYPAPFTSPEDTILAAGCRMRGIELVWETGWVEQEAEEWLGVSADGTPEVRRWKWREKGWDELLAAL